MDLENFERIACAEASRYWCIGEVFDLELMGDDELDKYETDLAERVSIVNSEHRRAYYTIKNKLQEATSEFWT